MSSIIRGFPVGHFSDIILTDDAAKEGAGKGTTVEDAEVGFTVFPIESDITHAYFLEIGYTTCSTLGIQVHHLI